MRFSRIEVRRVVRHAEELDDPAACKALFEILLARGLPFACHAKKLGKSLDECHVISLSDDSVRIVSRKPQKLNFETRFKDIESLEVISSRELSEEDNGGRWSMIG